MIGADCECSSIHDTQQYSISVGYLWRPTVSASLLQPSGGRRSGKLLSARFVFHFVPMMQEIALLLLVLAEGARTANSQMSRHPPVRIFNSEHPTSHLRADTDTLGIAIWQRITRTAQPRLRDASYLLHAWRPSGVRYPFGPSPTSPTPSPSRSAGRSSILNMGLGKLLHRAPMTTLPALVLPMPASHCCACSSWQHVLVSRPDYLCSTSQH